MLKHTKYIIQATEGNWLTEKEVDNIFTQTFSKLVIIENEEDEQMWVEITNEEKESIETEIKKITGSEELNEDEKQ